MNNPFEVLGYSVDYHVNKKYIGSINLDKPDRKTGGYAGRITSKTEEKIKLDNGKVIKKGTTITTYLQILCGKIKN